MLYRWPQAAESLLQRWRALSMMLTAMVQQVFAWSGNHWAQYWWTTGFAVAPTQRVSRTTCSHAGNCAAQYWSPHFLLLVTTAVDACYCGKEPVAGQTPLNLPTAGRNLKGDSAPRDRREAQNIAAYFWEDFASNSTAAVHVAWQFLLIWLRNTQLAPKGIEAPVLFPVLLILTYLPSTLKNEY